VQGAAAAAPTPTNYIAVIQGFPASPAPDRDDTPVAVVDLGGGTRFTEGINQSANTPHRSGARAGAEFFTAPAPGPQRRYEALRAYLHDGEPHLRVDSGWEGVRLEGHRWRRTRVPAWGDAAARCFPVQR
jgi:hypothetical protein